MVERDGHLALEVLAVLAPIKFRANIYLGVSMAVTVDLHSFTHLSRADTMLAARARLLPTHQETVLMDLYRYAN